LPHCFLSCSVAPNRLLSRSLRARGLQRRNFLRFRGFLTDRFELSLAPGRLLSSGFGSNRFPRRRLLRRLVTSRFQSHNLQSLRFLSSCFLSCGFERGRLRGSQPRRGLGGLSFLAFACETLRLALRRLSTGLIASQFLCRRRQSRRFVRGLGRLRVALAGGLWKAWLRRRKGLGRYRLGNGNWHGERFGRGRRQHRLAGRRGGWRRARCRRT
jgi:hypothetical protein